LPRQQPLWALDRGRLCISRRTPYQPD
jgi:hypothetical protein